MQSAGGFRSEVQPRRQHWFLNEKSGFPFRTPAFCSVSRGQRRLGEKEYRAPSVTPGVALRDRTQDPKPTVDARKGLWRRVCTVCQPPIRLAPTHSFWLSHFLSKCRIVSTCVLRLTRQNVTGRQRPQCLQNVPSRSPSSLAANLSSASLVAHILRWFRPVYALGA